MDLTLATLALTTLVVILVLVQALVLVLVLVQALVLVLVLVQVLVLALILVLTSIVPQAVMVPQTMMDVTMTMLLFLASLPLFVTMYDANEASLL